MKKTTLKKLFTINPVTIALFFAVLGCVAYSFEVSFLDLMELKTVDLRFKSRGSIAPDPHVVLAVVDEKSLDREGKWVWPRSKMVSLVDKLSDAGARVAVFDIGFLEPDDQRSVDTVRRIREAFRGCAEQDPDFDLYMEALTRQSDYDRLLAEAIKQSRARVVLGYFFHMHADAAGTTEAAALDLHERNISGSGYKLVHYDSAAAERFSFIRAAAPESNVSPIAESTDTAGFFNIFPDSDGVVRWIPAVIQFRKTLYAPLALKALGAYFDQPLALRVAQDGVLGITIGNRWVPTDEMGRILINYHGPVKTFDHISITDILHDRVPVHRLKDKIVLIGATAVGIYDMRVTPFGSVFPGLEIHANVISAVLSDRFLFQPIWARFFDVLAIAAAGMLVGTALWRLSALPGALSAVGLFFGYILGCHLLFVTQGWVLNLVYPLLVMAMTYVGITGYHYFTEARQKRFIRDIFSTYLAPAVVEQLIDSPETLNLGGEERHITAFFSDVEGFTQVSEKLAPTDLVELLNNFLTEMTDIILTHEGTVDKFEGDAIIAFFGAPNIMENHAQTAALACIEMQQRLAELRETWQAFGWPALRMRIGMCTGTAVVGNMGSKSRMDYTMMGDTVNIAARLEAVNKIYGTYTLVCDAAYREMSDAVVGRELDAVKVVGKSAPVKIHELLCRRDAADARTMQIVDLYARGLAAYRRRDWQGAMRHFMALLKRHPADGPSRTLFLRSRRFMDTPPPEDWNGAFTIRSK